MKSKLLAPVALFVGVIFSTPSLALDIPLLTWEQGKSQSVVLGGPTASDNWQVSLVAASGVKTSFRASAINNAGFRVYTIDLSNGQAAGRYTVETQGPGSPRNVVSEVLVVPAESYEVPMAPFDLLFILGFLAVFLSAVVSVRKAKTVVSSFPNPIADIENLVLGKDLRSIKRFKVNSLESKRVRFLNGLPESFLKKLLLADSNFSFTLPLSGFVYLPILSITLGSLLFLSHESREPFSQVSYLLLALLIVVSHLDVLAGILGAISFLAFHVVLSGALDVRNGFAALVLVGVFIFPAMFSIIGKLTSIELHRSAKVTYSVLSIFGILYIPCAYLVIKSLTPGITLSSDGIPYLMVFALISIALKNQLMDKFLGRGSKNSAERSPETSIPRLFSDGSIVVLSVALTILFMNWTENLTISLLAAFAWTVPLLLSSIRLDGVVIRFFSRVPRVIWLEIALVLSALLGIFLIARKLPYLVEDVSALLLVILAIPSAIHALFVLLVSSHKDQEVTL
jgi:hypothetical protein